MIRLDQKTQAEAVEHHRMNPVRVYSDDTVQRDRILRSRAIVSSLLGKCNGPTLVELGCGTADICGPFAQAETVYGFDCHAGALEVASRRFPRGIFALCDIEAIRTFECDILVLCETLEHLVNPRKMVDSWLPLSEYVIISHPVDEPFGSGISGGDHRWSFSFEDFENWFEPTHQLREWGWFQMGAYRIILGWGKRIR
jgi:predicted RNA methylase